MRKLWLLKNPELFQGKDKVKKAKDYFEGWYFKHMSSGNEAISLIPGINLENGKKQAFIQIITNENTYFVAYDFDSFEYRHQPFGIKIGSSYFSKTGVKLDIHDEEQNIFISGKLKYGEMSEIAKNTLAPNIMGPFSYLPFMECNHAILSMRHDIHGEIRINDQNISFEGGTGYIEKDWGCSFPKSYLWCQSNDFGKSEGSIMFSLAHIPFQVFDFEGFICVFLLNGKEYRFTTYNGSKITMLKTTEQSALVEIKKRGYLLRLNCKQENALPLAAPKLGMMDKMIRESLSSTMDVTLVKGAKVLYRGRHARCGLEIVKSL